VPYILAAIVAAIAALFGVASRKPETFTISRSTTINASPEEIFPLINDFHRWASWSPFEKLDPAMHKTFSGPSNGVGSAYAWTGNKKAGAGSMNITNTTPSSNVTIAMEFLKPFKSQSTAIFDIAGSSPGTGSAETSSSKVTWSMTGKNHFASKVMSVFVSMDKLIGKDFVEGLANLKREAEVSGSNHT
jgi:Polyketide cyclase / dehydrase and lipid transport